MFLSAVDKSPVTEQSHFTERMAGCGLGPIRNSLGGVKCPPPTRW
jgi:hypothetical protein